MHPSVQINNTQIITNSRYIGDAFVSSQQPIIASLVSPAGRLPVYAESFSFLGIIAQDTQSLGCDSARPCDIAFIGMFRQNNGTFRYGYEINGVRLYSSGHVPSSDYKYDIDFHLNEEGQVTDPAYPHQIRYGYDFQISSGWDSSVRIHGLQSSPYYADQIFVGVMDAGNNVYLPDNKQLELNIWVSGGEQAPDAIYKNTDNTSQVSSQYDTAEDQIVLTLSGSY